jgi:tetratricopeptide (TPR) repeat protein
LALDLRLSTLDYCLVVLFFALGLMCKPMLVTVPFVLLLLDYWPLNRVATVTDCRNHFQIPRRLILEKLPLFGLAAAACATTLFAQKVALWSFEQVSLPLRVSNALISYVTYVGQMFWPSDLAVYYPFPTRGVGVAGVVLSLVVWAGISTGVFVLRRRPYLLTGWLWYLIMLVPVIGIVQVGSQARADRYTYLPQIGLYLLLTWATADLCAGWRYRRAVLGGCSTSILIALIFSARAQTSYWRNSESLWTHTLACTTDNFICLNNLGLALLKNGNVDEAIHHFQTALEIRPGFAEAHYNLGCALLKKGSVDEAIHHFQQALRIKPDSAEAHNNLGNALFKMGREYEALSHFQKALQIKPDYTEAHSNLGNALLEMGSLDEAIVHYQQALEIKPDYAEAQYNLGYALLKKGSVDKAIYHYQRALEINPDFVEAQNNLAWVLATCSQASLRNGNKAVELAERANQFTGHGNPVFLDTLATAYAEAGRFPEAVETAQRALQLAGAHSNPALADAVRTQIKLYQAGIPFHYTE